MSQRLMLWQLAGILVGGALGLGALLLFHTEDALAGIAVACIGIFVCQITAIAIGLRVEDLRHRQDCLHRFDAFVADLDRNRW